MTITEIKCPKCGEVTAHEWGTKDEAFIALLYEYAAVQKLLIKELEQAFHPMLVTNPSWVTNTPYIENT